MKKSRKKMLLSSIAMLLVALVALGSATFAWYYVQNQVTASTTTWSASTADGLVIRHKTGDAWVTSIDTLETKTSLSPATINYDSSLGNVFGATGLGTSRDNGALAGSLKGKDLPAAHTTTDGNFLVDEFYVASNSASAQLTDFVVNGTTQSGTYLNLAIYVNGIRAAVMTSDADAGEKVAGQAGGTKASTTSVTTGEGLQALTKLNTSVNIGKFNAAAKNDTLSVESGTKITVIAFADGYNSKCTSATANNTNVSVTYEFNVTTGTANLGV